MFTVPVYVAAGNCGTTVVLIFQVSVVVLVPVLLTPVILTWPICTPVAAAGVMKAGTPAPPLATVFNAPPALPEPEAAALTALAGILSPAPSVKAAVPLATHAHSVIWVRPGFRVHPVKIVLVVLPGLAAVLAASVKLTVGPPVTLTKSDSDMLAFRTTVPMLELIWALAVGQIAAASTAAHPTISNFRTYLIGIRGRQSPRAAKSRLCMSLIDFVCAV